MVSELLLLVDREINKHRRKVNDANIKAYFQAQGDESSPAHQLHWVRGLSLVWFGGFKT